MDSFSLITHSIVLTFSAGSTDLGVTLDDGGPTLYDPGRTKTWNAAVHEYGVLVFWSIYLQSTKIYILFRCQTQHLKQELNASLKSKVDVLHGSWKLKAKGQKKLKSQKSKAKSLFSKSIVKVRSRSCIIRLLVSDSKIMSE